MIDKQFLIFSDFVYWNKGKCDCGFQFVDGDLMETYDEDINPETVFIESPNTIEFFCPKCGKQLATLTTYEVDEDFDKEMLQPFKDANIPLPFDRLGEMEKVYSQVLDN